jgi:hypothetical protein
VVDSCEHGNGASGSVTMASFLTGLRTITFSKTLLHEVS